MAQIIGKICVYFTILLALASCSNQPADWTLHLLDFSNRYDEVDFDEFSNSVWLSTFQGNSIGIYNTNSNELFVETLPNGYQQLTTCIEKSVWVVTTDKTLLKYDRQTNLWEIVSLENFIFKTCRKLPNGEVVLYSDTRILFPETFNEVVIPESVGSILDFTKDKNQTLWVLTTKGLIWSYSDHLWVKHADIGDVKILHSCGEHDLCIWGDNDLYRWRVSSNAFSPEKILTNASLHLGEDSIVLSPDNRLFFGTRAKLWSIDESGLKSLNLPLGVNKIWSIDTDARSNLFVLTNLGLFYFNTAMMP